MVDERGPIHSSTGSDLLSEPSLAASPESGVGQTRTYPDGCREGQPDRDLSPTAHSGPFLSLVSWGFRHDYPHFARTSVGYYLDTVGSGHDDFDIDIDRGR
jgi:hypothetical protein